MSLVNSDSTQEILVKKVLGLNPGIFNITEPGDNLVDTYDLHSTRRSKLLSENFGQKIFLQISESK